MQTQCQLSKSRLGLLYVSCDGVWCGPDTVVLAFCGCTVPLGPCAWGNRDALGLVQCCALGNETRGDGIRGRGERYRMSRLNRTQGRKVS
jgi:hypothetical protein